MRRSPHQHSSWGWLLFTFNMNEIILGTFFPVHLLYHRAYNSINKCHSSLLNNKLHSAYMTPRSKHERCLQREKQNVDSQCYHASPSSASSRRRTGCHCPSTPCCQECTDTRSDDGSRCRSRLPRLDSIGTSARCCHHGIYNFNHNKYAPRAPLMLLLLVNGLMQCTE